MHDGAENVLQACFQRAIFSGRSETFIVTTTLVAKTVLHCCCMTLVLLRRVAESICFSCVRYQYSGVNCLFSRCKVPISPPLCRSDAPYNILTPKTCPETVVTCSMG